MICVCFFFSREREKAHLKLLGKKYTGDNYQIMRINLNNYSSFVIGFMLMIFPFFMLMISYITVSALRNSIIRVLTVLICFPNNFSICQYMCVPIYSPYT